MSDRLVALIDMDCFYCQVETRLNPALKGKPLAVVQYNQWKGGGIIAVNYEARDRGVTRHMRGNEAKKHCPEIQLVSVPAVRGKADLTKYRDAGREVIQVLCEFSECVQRASVDEAYIDLTEAVDQRLSDKVKVTPAQLENTFVIGYSPDTTNDEDERERGVSTWLQDVYGSDLHDPGLHRLATATALVEQMRAAVFEKTGFCCSAGISHNKILAKLVCGVHKPNRQTVLPMSSVQELYRTLPVKKVRNLGGKLGDDVVDRLGITHMAELVNFTEKQLQAKYDDKTGTWLYNIARGIDLDPVTPRLVSKSIGCCKKFPGKTALTTKPNVTHWLSELATEVAERLDEDIHMNKRKAQLLTVSFSQKVDCRDMAMTRSVALPGYDAERIATCAFNILSKHSSTHNDDGWSPPITFLGLSVGKFMDYSGNTSGSIDRFFKAAEASSSSKVVNNDVSEVKYQLNSVDNTSKDSVTVENSHDLKIVEGCSSIGRKDNALSNGQVSFFERYFQNQPNKIVRKSPKKQSKIEDKSSTNQENDSPRTDEDQSRSCKPTDEKIDNSDSESNFGKQIQEEINKNEEAWISPSEIFPDMENIDESLVNILPSPLQRKIFEIKNSKDKILSGSKTKMSDVVGGSSRVSTDSDCAPTRVETVADIHILDREQRPATSSKYVMQRREAREEEEDAIEPEGLFDTTSVDLFELEAGEELEENEDQREVCDTCSYCGVSIPVSELPEHLDHHVAMELHEQLNRQPQSTRTEVSNQIRPNKPVTNVFSDKKKRGRPSKKDVVPPKKSRTIMSFFSKS